MDQFLENRQNYMIDNNSMQQLNVASAGDGVVGGVQAEVVTGVAGEILGGKYDEHHEELDVGDDDELKYVEEVQQSEKQQQQLQTLKNIGLDDDGTYESNELAEKETSNKDVHDFGNGNGGFVFGGDHGNHQPQQHHDLFNIGNGHDTNGHDIVNVNENFGTLVSTGFEEKLNIMESELGCFKNQRDFSSTSNVTESAEDFVPQIDVKIETEVEHHEMADEEEPSSLATNTTNGTSSLSENILPQAITDLQTNTREDLIVNLEDKENSDPLTPQRPNDLDLDQAHSQLNPDAKEFIPSFGSNPPSPTSPFAANVQQTEPVLSEIMETQMYFGQAPSVVQRHLLEDDDFVAQSPRKGKGDNNMDTVSVPRELSEFEKEADKRPHELEPEVIESFGQKEEVLTPDQAIQQLPLDDTETQYKENHVTTDLTDTLLSNYGDHGPETSVDNEVELDMQPSTVLPCLQSDDDVMKKSIYVANDATIEDVLNSVQPIPTEIDSINNSFIEESATESTANQLPFDKELLQIEEKEHVSHSPSTEEIQMNLQNTLNSSNKDIPQLPVDIDNENNKQEEFTLGEKEEKYLQDQEQNQHLLSQSVFELKELSQDHEQPKQFEGPKEDNLADGQSQSENLLLHEENPSQEEPTFVQEAYKPEEQQNELQPDLMENLHSVEKIEERNLDETANYLSSDESFLENALRTEVLQQEVNEPLSPFKGAEEESLNVPAIESLNETNKNFQQTEDLNTLAFDSLEKSTPENIQHSELNDVIMTVAADQKHLLEETEEQQLFSVSGLEQQMSEMMLNSTDCNLSQAEEVAATTTTSAIEDISENLIAPDEAIDQEEQEDHDHLQHHTLVDDSFNQHEQECLQQYEQELEQKQEMPVETETKLDSIHESLESPIENTHQEELENEMIAIKEPLIEAQQITSMQATNEETDIETEERQELPPPKVAETVPAELPETTVITQIETEIEEKQTEQKAVEVEAEIIKEPEVEDVHEKQAEAVKEDVVATLDISTDLPVEAAALAASAVVATTAAVAATAASLPSSNKNETLSKTTTTVVKSKVGTTTAAKKPAEAAKKPIGLTAKPRTAPAKAIGVTAEKKPTTSATTTAHRKPTTTTTASKVVAKTTTTTTTTRMPTATSKTTTKPTTNASKTYTTPRSVPAITSATRKPATANGSLAKPRPATAPAKPSTLALSATNGAPKTKPLSPRSTLTTQVRKITPSTTAAKSPVKSAATNGVAKTGSTTSAPRTKTTTSTVSSTAGTATKTFTARPAPKFTSSSSSTTTTNTTARRSTTGVTTTSTTTSTLKTSGSPLRKSTPTKAVATKTPTKSTTTVGGLKSKTPITKPASPAAKPAPIRKPVDNTKAAVVATNVEENANKQSGDNKVNSDTQAVQQDQQKQNGDSSIPMQTEKEEHPFLDHNRDEQTPMDLTNA